MSEIIDKFVSDYHERFCSEHDHANPDCRYKKRQLVEMIQGIIYGLSLESDTRIKQLESAISDCYMAARRRVPRGDCSGYNSEAFYHIIRFCESTGAKSDILRNAVPTEITSG